MAFEFPSNPSVGDTYSIFTWNGDSWDRTPPAVTAETLATRLALLEEQIQSPPQFVRAGDDVRLLTAPTGADGEPADYNIVVVDKSNGSIKTIPAPDYIEVE